MTAAPLLSLRDISKVFPNGTVALKGVDLRVEPGRVHGLLGANGAGKSTLIKILSGVFPASDGVIEWKGKPVDIHGPGVASSLGIAAIHQHIPLAPTLSVLENVFLSEPGIWRMSSTYRVRYESLCERLDYRVDPNLLVSDLSIGQRQMVAILTALMTGADLIVMDEPTASLATEERELVYRTVRHLTASQGKAILFVSHFLDEVIELTDRVSVLRDGLVVLEQETAQLNEAKIAEAIVGREVVAMERASHERRAVPAQTTSAPLLEVKSLMSPGRLKPVSFNLAKGEVLGLAGLLGSGRSELLHAIFGADPAAGGEVRVAGKRLRKSTGAAVKAGIALVPEERMAQGLIPGFEIWKNITLPALNLVGRLGLLPDRDREAAYGQEAIDRLKIKAQSPNELVTELSGGNAQKVTIGKWLVGDMQVFLLDEPTHGIDIGAKTDVLRLVRSLSEAGKGIIIASSEFEELLAVCDRILVLRDGQVTGEVAAQETDEHKLLLMAGGGEPPAKPSHQLPETGQV